MSTDLKSITNFLYEVGILAKTPRSGFYFLGSGQQSVAEHINRVCYIGYILAKMDGKVEVGKVVEQCLFHDISESRISDLNYVHQQYTKSNEEKAKRDLCNSLPFGHDICEIMDEYEKRETPESLLAKDADNIEWIISLKEQFDTGNTRAKEWIPSAIKRLKTEPAKNIVKVIMDTESDEWWFSDKESDWWVNRS